MKPLTFVIYASRATVFEANQFPLAQPCHWLVQLNFSKPACLSLFSMFRLGNASIPMSYKTNSAAVYMHLKTHPGEHSYGFHLLHHFPPEGLP